MTPTPEDRYLGEYRLIKRLADNPLTHTWLAEQVSVSRRVLVDELRSEQADHHDAFLADVRAKAAIEHPLIGSVYEAVSDPGLCYFAHELLHGTTLADRAKEGTPFPPVRLAHLLRRVSEALLQQESLSQASSPLLLDHLHLDDQGVLRLDNLAIAGPRPPQQAARDIVHLGTALPALVAPSQPGSSRMLTLLSWMRGEQLSAPLTWAQVRDLCTQIEQQLAIPLALTLPGRAGSPQKKLPVAVLTASSLIALIVVLVISLRRHSPSPPAALRSPLPAAVVVADGSYPTPDGTVEPLKGFRISANEVTIGQYAEFLETLATLAKEHRQAAFDSPDQPPTKPSHLPDDWPAMLTAARSHENWHACPLTLDAPVVGVDWWDCSAYTEWRRVRLPTQEEWFAALGQDLSDPATLPPAAWIQVTAATADRTPHGLIGMAGSVCEWTRCPAVNPSNPLGGRQWVMVGGSFLKPGSNALTREWTDDRSLRRADLGFRVVSDARD